MIQILMLLKKFLKTERNLVGTGMIFSLLYGFLYSYFWIDLLSFKGFALLTWINVLFALFLVSQDIYFTDLKDGFLEFLLSEKMSIYKIFISKVLYIYIGYLIPILVISFANGLLSNQEIESILNIVIGILILSPGMVCLIHTGSLFTLYSQRNGFLVPILMIPFFIPPLIFGISISNHLYEDNQFTTLLFGSIGLDLLYITVGVVLTKFLLEGTFE